MKLAWAPVLVSVACLSVSGCRLPWQKDDAGPAPKGQVVAVVKGQEVTLTDLRAELEGESGANTQAQKQLEQAGLERIIGRKLLAMTAHDRGLDRTPDFAVDKMRGDETILALALQTRIASQVPPPTRDEAERYVADHPDMFAQRKFFVLDQLRVKRPPDTERLKQLEPLKTMDQVEAWLMQQHIEYDHTVDVIDTLNTNPQLVDFLLKLPPDEVFVIPNGDLLLIDHIVETKVLPVTGDVATARATDVLRSQRTLEAVARAENQILARSASAIRYNDAYKPTTPAAQPASNAASSPPASNGATR
jgi:EpsD family peptidyl-prolyl cis-trans isomerase